MTKIALIMLSTLLLSGIFTFGRTGAFRKPPTNVFGEWRIYKFVEVGGHAGETRNLADKQVGKSLRLELNAFSHDDDFLWFRPGRCKQVHYKLEFHKYSENEVGEKGTLAFYGLDAAEDDRAEFVIVTCGTRHLGRFEITRVQELAVYYDGWFFFLKKAKHS